MSDREEGFSPKHMLRCVLTHGALAVGVILVLLMLAALAITKGTVPLESRLVLVMLAEFLGVLLGSYRAAKKAKSRKLPIGFLTGLTVFLVLSVIGFFFSFPPAGHGIYLFLVTVLASLSGSMLSERKRSRK